MTLEDDDFTQIVAEAVREVGRVTAKRESAQRAVESMVERVGLFNGDKVPSYMEAYHVEMDVRGVNDALRLEFFCQVAAPWIHVEVRELGEAHSSWETFGEAYMANHQEAGTGATSTIG